MLDANAFFAADVAHRPMVYAEWIHKHIIYEWYASKHKTFV